MAVVKNWSCALLLLLSGQSVATSNTTSEFQQWQKQRAQQFQRYVSEQDQQFSQFLQQSWLSKDVEFEIAKRPAPKLKVQPQTPDLKATERDTTEKAPDAAKEQELASDLFSDSSITPFMVNSTHPVNIEFLGHQLLFNHVQFQPLPVVSLNAQTISQSWQTMAQHKHSDWLEQLSYYANKLNLDDWGKVLLTHQVLQQMAGELTDNERNLYTWYYLLQLGLDARVGYQAQTLYLLANVAQTLYGQKFFRFDQDKYYFVNFTKQKLTLGAQIQTYQQQHQGARSQLSIELGRLPVVAGQSNRRKLTFDFAGQSYQVSVPYHAKYVELLSFYPQLELKHYFNSELEVNSKRVLLTYLAQQISQMDERQALNFLLRFVQNALAYQTDDEQFNQENFLLASETLHYPYADCEDRVVLFSYLVKNLLGNKIVGVLYQGHVATAVKLKSEQDGAGYRIDGEKYLVADPTYLGANVGAVMPGYESQSPRLIKIN